jgi:dTDP-4-amino-4,6-dideoxygalactose transaminase
MLAYAHAMGAPRAQTNVAFHAPWFDEREVEALREALAGRVAGDGPIGRRVEALLAERLSARHVLLTTSAWAPVRR